MSLLLNAPVMSNPSLPPVTISSTKIARFRPTRTRVTGPGVPIASTRRAVGMPVAELDRGSALPRLDGWVGILRAAAVGAAGLGHAPIVHSGAMKTGAGLSTADDARVAATEASRAAADALAGDSASL